MTTESNMTRRGILVTGAALAVGTLGASSASSAEIQGAAELPFKPGQLGAVVEATANCQKVGEACLAFSVMQLGEGMTRMSRCQKSCINMLALTDAMLTVATHATADAETISGLAAVTARACRECENACAEFEAAEYKKCAESCRHSAVACEALSGR